MGMVVQHNMNALNAYNKLNVNVAGMKKSSEKLASGYRINRAGDDAAGLAISEKMRSQIKGLNQAVRNSQDGINMIQTYEGAAQESHSILQRMKELASEAANGTYQNEVDRDAIQLEFNQLNNELDQISDTDFNGTVMLNGGQMADGTRAVNGKFDYANGTDVAARELSKGDVNVLEDSKWNNGNKAKDAWAALNSSWTREDGKPNTYGPDSVDVEFVYNSSTNTWATKSATNGANKAQVTTEATENGGFKVLIGGEEAGNVVIDTTSLNNGDSITLTFNNPSKGIDAPTKAGAKLIESTRGSFIASTALDAPVIKKDTFDDLTVKVESGLANGDGTEGQDAKMTAGTKELLDKLNSATVTIRYTGKTTAAGDMTIDFGNGESYNSSTAEQTLTTSNGETFKLVFTAEENKLEIKTEADTGLITITGLAATEDGDGAGTAKFDLGIEYSEYDEQALPSIEVAKTGSVSKANSFTQATAPLTYTDHLVLQTGARTKDSVDFSMEYSTEGMGDLKANLNISSRADGLNTANLTLATQEDANYAIDQIDNAINKVSMVRATFGATQNRLEHKITNLTTTAENLTEAESSIRDTDMASEMMNYTKFNILQQAAQSMLAQANQQPQSILQLLG